MESLENVVKKVEEFSRRFEDNEEIRKPRLKCMINDKYPIWDMMGYISSFINSRFAYHHLNDPSDSIDKKYHNLKENPTKENVQKFQEHMQEYLDLCRILGFIPSVSTLGKSTFGDELAPYVYDKNLKRSIPNPELSLVLTQDQLKENWLLDHITLQGNGRFVGIYASPEKYRKAYDEFTTSRFGLDENLLFTLVVNINHDYNYSIGAAPILFDPILRETYPEDTKILARLCSDKYFPKVDNWMPGSKKEGLYILDNLSNIFGLSKK